MGGESAEGRKLMNAIQAYRTCFVNYGNEDTTDEVPLIDDEQPTAETDGTETTGEIDIILLYIAFFWFHLYPFYIT